MSSDATDLVLLSLQILVQPSAEAPQCLQGNITDCQSLDLRMIK